MTATVDAGGTRWPATSAGWRAYFAAHRLLDPADVGVVHLADSAAARALVRSLRRFQAGESSGLHLADEARRSRGLGLDEDLVDAVARFMAEEHRHGELLAGLLGGLGATTAHRDLSTTVFVWVRRRFGLRAKFAVLMVAEIVGIAVYEALAEAVDDDMVRRVIGAVAADEAAHLAFGGFVLDRMITADAGPLRQGVRRTLLLGWLRAVLAAAVVGVTADHFPLLRRIGIRAVWRRARRLERALADDLAPTPNHPLVVALAA